MAFRLVWLTHWDWTIPYLCFCFTVNSYTILCSWWSTRSNSSDRWPSSLRLTTAWLLMRFSGCRHRRRQTQTERDWESCQLKFKIYKKTWVCLLSTFLFPDQAVCHCDNLQVYSVGIIQYYLTNDLAPGITDTNTSIACWSAAGSVTFVSSQVVLITERSRTCKNRADM